MVSTSWCLGMREGTLSHIDQMTTLVDYRVGCVCVLDSLPTLPASWLQQNLRGVRKVGRSRKARGLRG